MLGVPNIKITYCIVVLNRLEESKRAIRRHAPFCDRTIVIDGGSWDKSVEWFNSQECKNLKVECYVHPWVDDPPGQRTRYLDLIKDGWVLVTDCDEYLELPALYKLRQLAQEAEDHKCDGIAFVAHDVQTLPDGRVNDSKSSYYNRIFFKADPGMRYMGHTHVALCRPNLRDSCMKTEYKYYHIKPWADQFIRACRNYWTTCGVAANKTDDPHWKEFKKLTTDAGFKYFYQFAEYMRKGDVDSIFKKWFIDHRDDSNPEARSWFVSYFVFMHPEENVDKISNSDTPYVEGRKSIKLNY